jgi:hypothetical protein
MRIEKLEISVYANSLDARISDAFISVCQSFNRTIAYELQGLMVYWMRNRSLNGEK